MTAVATAADEAVLMTFPGQIFDANLIAAALRPFDGDPLVDRLAARVGTDDWASLDCTDASVAGPCSLSAGLLLARSAVDRTTVAAAAGHSFGEITAVAYAGGLSDDDALDIVEARGRLSGEVSRTRPGGMLAVMGLDLDDVEWIRRSAIAETGAMIEVAGINDRQQFVLTGDQVAVDVTIRLVGELAGLAVLLPPPGAYHSPAMRPAVARFEETVRRVTFRPLDIPVYSAIDGNRHDDSADFGRLFSRGLVMPVRWRDVVSAAHAAGLRRAVDAGPGDTLAKLGRRGKLLTFTTAGSPEAVAR